MCLFRINIHKNNLFVNLRLTIRIYIAYRSIVYALV